MRVKHSRMLRENKTIEYMMQIYCSAHHGTNNGLCPHCTGLLKYASFRLGKCPYQEKKPTCAKCPVHCYKPGMREEIKVVMRFSGPRMLFKHPVLAVLHLLDGFRKVGK